MLPKKSIAAIVLVIIVASCSIVKKEDTNEDILAFLSSFEKSLAKTDEEILKQFDVRSQSVESIVKAIRILQNKEDEYIRCEAAFQQAQINRSENGIEVIVPVIFYAEKLDADKKEPGTLTMFLGKKDDAIVVSTLDGEPFYKTFADLRNDLTWMAERQHELDKRVPIYQRADELQTLFDSVIWYATYRDKNYFYVVNGTWQSGDSRRTISSDYTMGLVDESGAIVIPVEYELIRTIGFDEPSIVEIVKDGKTGYFNIDTKQVVIEPAYDMIIPYSDDEVSAIVKTDTTYGWLNKKFAYTTGFPSDKARAWVYDYKFIPEKIHVESGLQTFCEIPNVDYAGNGVLLAPSYLVLSGLFNEIISGISTTPFPLTGWTAYVETKKPALQQITETIQAVFTSITERYLEGREEFYTHNRLVFVNQNNDTLSVANISSDSVIHIKHIDNNILEIKSPCSYCFEPYPADDSYIPDYTFFALGENGSIQQLESHRAFPATEFVKIDSSYLIGEFTHWDQEIGEEQSTTFLSLASVTYMRDEILASYGYIFPGSTSGERFSNYQWYTAKHQRVEDFESELSDVDRYNLAFLEKIILLMTTKPA